MSQLKIAVADFHLTSRWRCIGGSNGTRFIAEGPTTASVTKTFAFSLLANARVNFVRLYATLGSPLSGIAMQTANDMPIGSQGYAELDAQTFAAQGNSYAVTFRFRANGAIYSDTNYHEGTLSYTNVYLLIDYTIPNSEWTIENKDIEAGGIIGIDVEPYDLACTHEVDVQFGTLHQVYQLKAEQKRCEISVPYGWLVQIPNATFGFATVRLRTILNDVVLGESDAENVKITCPASVVPTIGRYQWEIVNPLWDMCVQYYSSLQFTLQQCLGAYGSTIENIAVYTDPYIGTYTWTPVNTSSYLIEFPQTCAVSGYVSVQIKVTDSRGRSFVIVGAVNVMPYTGPAIVQTVQGRANANGAADSRGERVYAGIEYSYSQIGDNAINLQILYRASDMADWVIGYEGALDSGEIVLLDGHFDLAKVYEVRYILQDALTFTSITRTVGTAYAFMKWMPQQNAVGFGCIPSGGNRVQIGRDWELFIGEHTLADYIESMVGDQMGAKVVVDADGNCAIGGSTFSVDLDGNATL